MQVKTAGTVNRVGARVKARILAVQDARMQRKTDVLVAEEPMEIRLLAGEQQRSVAVTMRTPGHDFELALGFLHSENVISGLDNLARIAYCTDPDLDPDQLYNVVSVTLNRRSLPDLDRLERSFFTTSACGVCGKASLDALSLQGCVQFAPSAVPVLDPAILLQLPRLMADAQGLFQQTGGLHAAGLFDLQGNLLVLREDVGRHNAVDKIAGWMLKARLPAPEQRILLVSGRASFEIMQKALMAHIPTVCAISAPSHLAVAVAQTFGMTVIGFLRNDRFNVYSGDSRVMPIASPAEG